MKPPLTVEAKVAEELRNWLASELEQLDAPNTNQFAHHVVTILLHEDLDLEDEPLTAGDDFLRDIYSIKKSKTRDKQKKAAVQFLRSAVCCDDPAEAEIQLMVDELMVKIDETKSKMNTKKTSKRSLLAPIAINVETQTSQGCVKSDGSEEERRYNEAFPSLPGDESPCKEGARPTASNASVWNRSPPVGKENHKKKGKRKTSNHTVKHSYLFTCEEEAQACSIARQVAALALAETTVPNAETAEVSPSASHDSSSSSFSDSSSCWASAFRTVILTRIFSPSNSPLRSVHPCPADVKTTPKQFAATVIEGVTYPLPEKHPGSDLCPEKLLFRPIHGYPITRQKVKSQDESQELEDQMDLEVHTIYIAAENKKKEVQTKVSKLTKPASASSIKSKNEIDIVSFPNHFGTFWQDLIHSGVMSLYPDFSNKETGKGSLKDLATLAFWTLQKLTLQSDAKKIIMHYCSNFTIQGGVKMYTGYVLGALTDMFIARKDIITHSKNYKKEDIQTIDRFLEACLDLMNDLEAPGEDHEPVDRNSGSTHKVSFATQDLQQQWTGTSGGEYSCVMDFNITGDGGTVGPGDDVNLPSTCGYSPNFLDRIDLRYLDEDDRSVGKRDLEAMCETNNADQSSVTEKDKIKDKSDGNFLDWPSSTYKDMRGVFQTDSLEYVLPYRHDASFKLFKEQNRSTLQDDVSDGPSNWETREQRYFELFPVKGEQAQTDWDMITKELLESVTVRRNPFHKYGNSTNPYMPSMLASCLTTKESQFLQSAFVNSYFSTSCEEPPAQTISTVLALDCSELEQMLYSREMHQPWGMNQAQCELIRGRTCSNWLENNCRLGLLCPFSHPSI